MEFTNALVLVADQKVEGIKDIIPVLEQVTRLNKPLLIITEDVTGLADRHLDLCLWRWCTHILWGIPHLRAGCLRASSTGRGLGKSDDDML